LCFVSVLCVLFEIVNHGGRRGDAMRALARWRHPLASSEALVVLHRAMWPASMQALTRWRHPLASSEALVVLHRAMRPASHRRIRMVVKIVVDLSAFFVASISLLATTIDK
jgi:hypothetical protein